MILTHGSLFSGIGGFDLGFERAGIKTLWQVEIDGYANKILERHFPNAVRFYDIRKVGKQNLASVDIVSGGFPCQDISNAGKRTGIEGARSGLWREMHRIVCELRPKYVVVENVAALLNRGMGRVFGDLAAIGYDAEWQSIRASDVGAPHRRERIWIVAYSRNVRCNAGGSEQSLQRIGTHGETQDVANPIGSRQGLHFNEECETKTDIREASDAESCSKTAAGAKNDERCESQAGNWRQVFAGRSPEIRCSEWWSVEPDVGRVAHGIPFRVDRLKGLGNAIVPQIAEWIGRRIIESMK
jgi:DNA (cytosine-5)-methyltransferase 1